MEQPTTINTVEDGKVAHIPLLKRESSVLGENEHAYYLNPAGKFYSLREGQLYSLKPTKETFIPANPAKCSSRLEALKRAMSDSHVPEDASDVWAVELNT